MEKLFGKDARVAFIGDSITHNGRAIAHIQDYYRTHLPERRVRLYNLGIGGDSASGANTRMDEILSVHPTEAVVMFGVNDMGVGYYEKTTPTEEHLRLRAERRRVHREAVVKLVKSLRELSIPVTLCSAVGRDEYTRESEGTMTYGATEALLAMYRDNLAAVPSEAIKATVDYLTPLQALLERVAAMGGPALFVPDRTHPSPLGQSMMARIFLRAQGLPVTLPSAELLCAGWCEAPLSPVVGERLAVEGSWRDLHFVYPHQRNLCGEVPLPERIAFFAERAKTEAPGYIKTMMEHYVANAAREEEIFRRYMELTEALY